MSVTPFDPSARSRAEHIRARMMPATRIRPDLTNRYLVKGWLDRGEMSSVYAEPKARKTFAMLDLAMHVAAGWDWHGFRVTVPGTVLYIAGEGGGGIAHRIEALRRAKPDLVEAAENRFVLLPEALNLGDAIDVDPLLTALGGSEVALIVVDTVARAMGSKDENLAGDMGKFVQSVDYIRERTGAHVCVVHHTGKDAARGARGSNALLGAVSTEIRLERQEAISTMTTTAQRDQPSGVSFSFRLVDVEIGVDGDGEPVSSAVIEPTERPKEKPKLGAAQAVAMEALRQFTADCGVLNPGGTGWPAPGSRRCVDYDAFLAFLGAKMASDKPKNRRDMARRAIQDLIGTKQLVQKNEGKLWII